MQTTYSVNESKSVLKVKVISLPCFFSRFCMFCAFPRPYQVSVYRTNGPLVFSSVSVAEWPHLGSDCLSS